MKAKRHPLLAELTNAVSGRLPEETIEVLGHAYTIKLAKPEADDWVAGQTEGSTISAALLNARKPTLAVTLVAIDQIPVEQLFQPGDDLDPEVKELLHRDAKRMRDWRRGEILEWLREEVDPFVIDTLYNAVTKLSTKHKEAMKEIENFQKRTPSQS
jgi:hypothetical protein